MILKQIPFENIEPNPWQTRLVEDPQHITALMDSIKQDGLLQIPTCRPGPYGNFQLAFGHSRVAACRRLHAQGLFPPNFPLNITTLTDEEMFRHAVTENNSRKELTSIEIARAMQIYRDEFGKSSHEIGQLFGLSDSAVRNKIRLLALPEATQYQVERGALTESAARSLLQLQRFSPDKVLEVTSRAAEEQLTSDDVINLSSRLIKTNDFAVTMQPSWKTAAPTAGDDLWLLREWVPQLPEDDPAFNAEMYRRLLAAVEEEAIEAEHSPWDDFSLDDFEGMVASYFNRPDQWSAMYAEYGFRFLEVFRALIDQSHTCSACPFYLVNDGTHYCGVKQCWEWRQEQFLAEEGARLSAALGVSIYQRTEDGKSARLQDYSGWDKSTAGQEAVAALFEGWLKTHDPRLRLKQYGHQYRAFEATQSYFFDLVCVGSAVDEIKAAYQACEKKQKKNKEGSYQTDHLKWEFQQAKSEAGRQFIESVVVPVFQALFAGLHHQLLVWHYGDYRKPPAEEEMLPNFTQRFLVTSLKTDILGAGPTAVAEHLKELAITIGLDLPNDWLDRAAALEPVIEESAGD